MNNKIYKIYTVCTFCEVNEAKNIYTGCSGCVSTVTLSLKAAVQLPAPDGTCWLVWDSCRTSDPPILSAHFHRAPTRLQAEPNVVSFHRALGWRLQKDQTCNLLGLARGLPQVVHCHETMMQGTTGRNPLVCIEVQQPAQQVNEHESVQLFRKAVVRVHLVWARNKDSGWLTNKDLHNRATK